MQTRTLAFLAVVGIGFFLFGELATAYYQSFAVEADFETIAVRGCVEDWSASTIKQRIQKELRDYEFLFSNKGLQLDRKPLEWGKPCKSLSIQVAYQRELSLLGQNFPIVFHSSAVNSRVSPLASSKAIRSLTDQ